MKKTRLITWSPGWSQSFRQREREGRGSWSASLPSFGWTTPAGKIVRISKTSKKNRNFKWRHDQAWERLEFTSMISRINIIQFWQDFFPFHGWGKKNTIFPWFSIPREKERERERGRDVGWHADRDRGTRTKWVFFLLHFQHFLPVVRAHVRASGRKIFSRGTENHGKTVFFTPPTFHLSIVSFWHDFLH